MATSYTDGDIIADSFISEINGQDYIFNNLSMSLPTVQAERTDKSGVLAAKATRRDIGRMSGTAEIQVYSSAQNQEILNTVFEIPAEANNLGILIRAVIEEASQDTVANESRARSISARAVVPSAYVVDGAGTTAVDGLYPASGDSFVMGDYTLEAFVDAMVVEGAGTVAANGVYAEDGEAEGKPKFTKIGGIENVDTIQWISISPGAWVIFSDSERCYVAPYNVATPDLATSWLVDGLPPAPTVRRATLSDPGITSDYVTWRIVDNLGNVVYSNPTNSLTPPLTGWEVGTGDADAPTLSRATWADFL